MKRIFENIKIAFKSLNSNKLRSFLTMLGIIIGVGSVVAVMSVGAGAEASITENLQSIGTNVLTISPGRATPEGMGGQRPGGGNLMVQFGNEEEETAEGELYYEDVTALKDSSGLFEEVAPVVAGRNSTLKYQSFSGQVSVTGTTEDYLKIQGYEIEEGSFFTSRDTENWSNVAVLGSDIVNDYFGKVDPIGKTLRIDGQNFVVIGVLESVGSAAFGQSADSSIIIPVTVAQNKLYGTDTIDSIAAKVKSEDLMDQAQEQAREILRIQHHILPGDLNDFEIRSSTQFLEMANTVTGILTVTLASVAAISLLVGGIGIMNIMFVSVVERTREIGIRKAVGAKNRDILVQFLTESIVMSLSGGILGVGFALTVAWVLKTFTTLNSLVTATPIILAVSFSTAIGLIFGIFPAMRAAKLNPIQSLRHE
ncbi:MAG: ABC transporter permease [Actinobacteria bacterium]|nr:ABC transporter permease [Actinomycetota bacterium]